MSLYIDIAAATYVVGCVAWVFVSGYYTGKENDEEAIALTVLTPIWPVIVSVVFVVFPFMLVYQLGLRLGKKADDES